MTVDAQGRYGYEAWLLPQKGGDAETPKAESNGTGHYSVKLSRIGISDSELCYQQAASTNTGAAALDYCLVLADMQWAGEISVTAPQADKALELGVKGDITLSGFTTTNYALDRDLFIFDRLTVKSIQANGLDDAAFASLRLEKAAGLELTSAEGKHTITIADVDLSSFSYARNTIAVKKAAVNELGLEITLNADGSLDLEKWNPEPAAKKSTETAAADKGETRPIGIKVGEFSLDTKQLIEFTDLSVTPKMQAGLKELHFRLQDLDSARPDQKSPIELSAKTTRHGTVDIKGMVMPFEAKPSFDASGKITGLDLRTVSPKVEQAAGHIIKSGQMDADLKLFADKGQLDSKIALVLHHFNLKAKSKDDAAALDKVFGMPINQSLVLLKDKKGRIKLDIPITGDINNPEFDPTDAIIKATTKATTVTLITFYTPYGLAFAGGNILFDLATALNFDPLVFDPGSAVLSEAHQQQLAKMAELLTERPGVHLTLCGYTNLKDRTKITTEIIDEKKIKPATGANLEKLQQLGGERQENVKNHLVNVGKISHDRLVLCAPEHSDDATAIGGVEISI